MAPTPLTHIVGAGAAGLSLAFLLDGDVIIHEATTRAGGLCQSTVVDGFTFDVGPHILGGIPAAVDWIVASTGIAFTHGVTRNRGYAGGGWVPHPFDDPRVGHRYMAKMWKTDPAKLLTPALSAQAARKPGGVPTFRYPAHGGYQAITDAWADQLEDRIIYDHRLDEDGDYDRVVWTGPLTGAPYNTLTTVTLGYEGPAPDLTAVYLPEDWTRFHRLSFPSAFTPSNAPPGCWSVQGEITSRGDTTGNLEDQLEETVHTLGLAHGASIFRHLSCTPHAYPVPVVTTGGRGSRGEYLHGRTGAHRYLNVDGVVAASMELAGRLNEHDRASPHETTPRRDAR